MGNSSGSEVESKTLIPATMESKAMGLNSLALLHGLGHYPEISNVLLTVGPGIKRVLGSGLGTAITEPLQDPEVEIRAIIELYFLDYRFTTSALAHYLGSSCSVNIHRSTIPQIYSIVYKAVIKKIKKPGPPGGTGPALGGACALTGPRACAEEDNSREALFCCKTILAHALGSVKGSFKRPARSRISISRLLGPG
jgi:hypothetical protein